MATCLLIDGNNLVYRAYYALERQRLKTRTGKPSGALYGFARMLLKLLRDVKPTHAAVAFDVARDTFRRRLYPEYKAHRKPTPPDIIEQMPAAHRLVQVLGVSLLTNPEYEADDLIGTVAEIAKTHMPVAVVSGDRDLLQLIDPQTTVKLCVKGITDFADFDVAKFEGEYKFAPERIVDLKALWGDSSDNIPGVDGIGEKKAMALIQQFGSLENLYQSLEKVSNARMKDQLSVGKDSAFLSHNLATIRRNVPGISDAESFAWKGFESCGPDLEAFFTEWDFLTLLSDIERKRHGMPAAAGLAQQPAKSGEPGFVPATDGQNPLRGQAHWVDPQSAASTEGTLFARVSERPAAVLAPPVLKPVSAEYLYVSRLHELDAFLAGIGPILCLDLETDGLDPVKNRIIGLSLAGSPDKAIYVPLRHAYLGLEPSDQLPVDEVFPRLQHALEGKLLVGHNLKFDLGFLAREKVFPRGEMFDTMLAAYVLDPTTSNGLKSLARELLGLDAVDYSHAVGSRKFAEMPIADAMNYACQDVILPLILMPRFQKELEARGFEKLFRTIEMPLMELLLEMETTGIGLNRQFLGKLTQELGDRLRILEKSIQTHAGYEFNVNSGKQLQEVLFNKLQLTAPKKIKTGFSTDAEVLRSLLSAHPIIGELLEYRELAKLKSTYAESLASLADPKTGLIHTSFNQTVTTTGRLSSSNPNMQNIPIKSEWGRKVRRAFVPPRAGDRLISIDYSQIELRLLAHFSEDEQLMKAYRENLDIHSLTAAKLFGKTPEEVTSEDRKIGKTVNFGIIYGISAHGLAQDLAIPRWEAQKYIDGFFATYPKVTEYFAQNLVKAKEAGKVATLFGRERPLPELGEKSAQTRAFGERVARNTPLQGSAADLVKKAMLDAAAILRQEKLNTKVILQIHDELVFSSPADEVEAACRLLKPVMENTVELRVPLVCDVAVGENLADMIDRK